MTLNVFSVFDSKTALFGNPFMMHNEADALRAFKVAVNDSQNRLSHHPDDFTLFYIGSFDSKSGKYTNLSTPISLGLAASYVSPIS